MVEATEECSCPVEAPYLVGSITARLAMVEKHDVKVLF